LIVIGNGQLVGIVSIGDVVKYRLEDLEAESNVLRAEARAIEAAFLKAYRWQYIHSGAQHPQFGKVLSSLITENQGQRIQAALAILQ
jgi:hypothetical protein